MEIQEKINLKPYNSFQLNCIADYFCVVESVEEFIELSRTDIYAKQHHLFL